MVFEKEDFSAVVNHIICQAEMGEAKPLHATQADDNIEYIGFTVIIYNTPEPGYYAYEYDVLGNHDLFDIQCPETDELMLKFIHKNQEEPWDVCIITITENIDDTTVDFLYGEESIPWLKPCLSLGQYVRPDNNDEKDEFWNHDVSSAYLLENPISTGEYVSKRKSKNNGPIEPNAHKIPFLELAGVKHWLPKWTATIEKLHVPIELPVIKTRNNSVIHPELQSIHQKTGRTEDLPQSESPKSNSAEGNEPLMDVSATILEALRERLGIQGEQVVLVSPLDATATSQPLVEAYYDDYPDGDYRYSARKKLDSPVEEAMAESPILDGLDVNHGNNVSMESIASIDEVTEVIPQEDPLPAVAHQAHIELIGKRQPYRSIALIICLTPPIVTTYGFWYNDQEDTYGFWTPESKPLDDAIDQFLIHTIPDPKKYWDACIVRIASRTSIPQAEFLYGEQAKEWLGSTSNKSEALLEIAKPSLT